MLRRALDKGTEGAVEQIAEQLPAGIGAATADDPVCKSGKRCLSHGMCLENPVCRALVGIGKNAGFVQPTSSACKCGFGEASFGGFICYCPTRWLLERRRTGDKRN